MQGFPPPPTKKHQGQICRQRKGKKEQNTFEVRNSVCEPSQKERKKESAGCKLLVTDGSVWILLLVPRALHKSVVNLGYSLPSHKIEKIWKTSTLDGF